MRRSSMLFSLVVLAQLAVPAWMIVAHERILREGEVFKFRTAPVDPRDPFRGEYVMLNFDAESGTWTDPMTTVQDSDNYAGYGEKPAFASLGTDSAGYALITGLSDRVPDAGAYIKVTYWTANEGTVDRVSLPFDRFYLQEGDGPKTEAMMAPQWNEGQVTQPLPAYALVRVYQGEAVMNDLIVGDKSIHEWMNEPPASAP